MLNLSFSIYQFLAAAKQHISWKYGLLYKNLVCYSALSNQKSFPVPIQILLINRFPVQCKKRLRYISGQVHRSTQPGHHPGTQRNRIFIYIKCRRMYTGGNPFFSIACTQPVEATRNDLRIESKIFSPHP